MSKVIKITKKRLKEIVKEEYAKMLNNKNKAKSLSLNELNSLIKEVLYEENIKNKE